MSMTTLDRPATVPPLVPEETALELPRLSDALRRGAAYHPQGIIHLYNKTTGATCALGALLVGLLGPRWTQDDPRLFEKRCIRTTVWDYTGVNLDTQVAAPPGYHLDERFPEVPFTLASLIVTLNDNYHWSREAIADYLESIGY